MFKFLSTKRPEELYREGRRLHWEGNYIEAEKRFRQGISRLEKDHGSQDERVIRMKHWLGEALAAQKKYAEAARILQQVVAAGEETLGETNTDTLDAKDLLGRVLYTQGRYKQAKEVYQQAAEACEEAFGDQNADTLRNKQGLGTTMYQLGEYIEAEKLLRPVVRSIEASSGRQNENTSDIKILLGRTLFQLERYSEAKDFIQPACIEHEALLGSEHKKSLEAKSWLQRIADKEKVYSGNESMLGSQAAEGPQAPPRQTVHQREDVNDSSRINDSAPSAPTSTTSSSGDQLVCFFLGRDTSSDIYSDSEISQISNLLKEASPEWSTSPRTYTILRIIGQLGSFNDLLHIGFSDYWLPVTVRSLPTTLSPASRTAFVNVQNLVLSKSACVENGKHCHFDKGEPLPFKSTTILGNGAFGLVDRIVSTSSHKEYARKRVLRSAIFRGLRKDHTRQVIAEIEILKRLRHHHIVELVGSYTDPKYIGLLMLPIAEMDLNKYLFQATVTHHTELRSFFGCLASALAYLHNQKIRHKDIKPANILVHHGNVLFVDFGLSLDFEDASGSTTAGTVNGRTPRYCAPEVALYEPRNSTSDVWSLGIVFLEMLAVLKGMSLSGVDEFFETHGTQQRFVRTNFETLAEFTGELRAIGALVDNAVLLWVLKMLILEPRARPTAEGLVAWIHAAGEHGGGEEAVVFCGACCNIEEEDFSDLEIDFRDLAYDD